MNILVTGATGFIGKNLVGRLLKERYDLTCLVRRTSNVDFLKTQNVALVTADITNAGEVNKIFSEIKPEIVFHCAAGVMEKDENVLYKANAEGTRNICRACLDNNIKKLIYVSSVAVISGNTQVPLGDDLPYKASNTYGRSKIEAERIAVEFRDKGLRVSILRPCMVYGEDEPHALDRILQLIKARRIPILDVAGMDSKLNLVYIDNVVQALMLAFKNDRAARGTFVIADPDIITLRKFLEILYDELNGDHPPVVPGWLVRPLMIIPPIGRGIKRFFKDRVYDITPARKILGYAPGISTEEALRKTVRYWKIKTGSSS